MTLWTASEAADATGGEARGDWSVTGVSIDTRTIAPGDLFVALKAARDGHDFVAQALEKGAAAALVSHIPEGVAPDAPLLLVDDVQTALEALGRASRARSQARVVAVTGSVGKTSTKEMLASMLGTQGRTHASAASYNNHWGVPLTLARMPRDTQFAVIEIGMNHPGEIAPLARQARPHVIMVTTVAAAHLEAFDSIAGIAREKASIAEGLEPRGAAILNADIDEAEILRAAADAAGARIVSFGRRAEEYRLLKVDVESDTTHAVAEVNGRQVTFDLQSGGAHFAMNALGALAVCAAMGADEARSIEALGHWTPYRGRGQRERITLAGGAIELIDDSYNANPASLKSSLSVLAAAQATRRVAILGDMKELGLSAEAMHAEFANHEEMTHIDRVHCIGPLMRALHAALARDRRGEWTETSAEMAARLEDLIEPGDIVLVKGSLSMDLARVVDALRKMGKGAEPDA
ncbi:UDP-N-acetylmuramoyl-tripeptide--D-alanyl-D-alanine ligase [Lutimaribacter marinistellae]|uniref:UDP-N-acetylmuramoyl-tripeptide--D-alanyl-D-alanine ligase n=1 Tax=Lutimaribacter marinistellae TaxID=1820329 RepID=A0ABV7THY6_9RHOB